MLDSNAKLYGFRMTVGLLLMTMTIVIAGCTEEVDTETASASGAAGYELATQADSLAMQVFEALGGPEAWSQLPYLQFDFAIENEGGRQLVARHFWNRQNGDYRVEWPGGTDSTFIALFNVDDGEGQVYLNGDSLSSSESDSLMEQAYRRYINDTYWMLAPIKMLDDGVSRTYVADSSDASTAVVRLSFDGVGLTPGDRYWFYIDRDSYRPVRWAMVLQHQSEDAAPSFFQWTGYENFSTPAGTLYVATRKEAVDGSRAILTDRVEMPDSAPADMFEDPQPMLLDSQ